MSILYSMTNVLPSVQKLFAVLDIDRNNSIDFLEFDNLIQTLIQQTNIAQNVVGDWQGIYNTGYLQELFVGLIPGFPIQNPGQLNLQEFNKVLGSWINHLGIMDTSIPFELNGGGVITGLQLLLRFQDLLKGLENGTININPAFPGMVVQGGVPVQQQQQQQQQPDQCAICMNEVDDGSDEISKLPCTHRFHRGCIQGFGGRMTDTCPTCRTPYSPDEIKGGHRRKTRRIKKARRKRKTRRKTHNKRGKNKSKSRKRKRTRKH